MYIIKQLDWVRVQKFELMSLVNKINNSSKNVKWKHTAPIFDSQGYTLFNTHYWLILKRVIYWMYLSQLKNSASVQPLFNFCSSYVFILNIKFFINYKLQARNVETLLSLQKYWTCYWLEWYWSCMYLSNAFLENWQLKTAQKVDSKVY